MRTDEHWNRTREGLLLLRLDERKTSRKRDLRWKEEGGEGADAADSLPGRERTLDPPFVYKQKRVISLELFNEEEEMYALTLTLKRKG